MNNSTAIVIFKRMQREIKRERERESEREKGSYSSKHVKSLLENGKK